MSFLPIDPVGRVLIEPKTSDSEGAPRVRRQPDAGVMEWSDGSCGKDGCGMDDMMGAESSIHSHSLVANNLQLHR